MKNITHQNNHINVNNKIKVQELQGQIHIFICYFLKHK